MYPPDSSYFKDLEKLDKWKFYFVKPKKVDNNLSVSNVSLLNRMKLLSQLISVETDIKNTGTNKIENVPKLYFQAGLPREYFQQKHLCSAVQSVSKNIKIFVQ